MANLQSDLRYTLRQLRRSPGFSLTAILTLSLAIGATTAMFSILRGTLLAPLPYPHAEDLVGLGLEQPGDAPRNAQTGESIDLIETRAKVFTSIGVADGGPPQGVNFSSEGGKAQNVHALKVSSGYLPTLGVVPILGRMFTREEDLPHATLTVLLSEAFWRHSFDADPKVVGKVVHINEDAYTVIGVMPDRFATLDSPDVWTPLRLSADDPGYDGTNYAVIARLKPGVTLAQAGAEMKTINVALFHRYPNYSQWVQPGQPPMQEVAWPLHELVVSSSRPSLLALGAAVIAVLLLACLNLAGLMTARSIARHSEITLRTALGASRRQILTLLLMESLLLALTGSLLGIGLAAIGLPVLLSTSPIDVTSIQVPTLDRTAVVFAALAGCATTLVIGLVPAFTISRHATAAGIGNTRTAGETLSQQRLGKSLVIAQVGLATAMLSAGALLLNAFVNMRTIPSGLTPQHVYALQVNLKGQAYASSAHTGQFVTSVEERLRQIPGVAQVATVNGLALDAGINDSAGPADRKDQLHNSEIRFVTPGYFRTIGTVVLQGHDISAADAAGAAPEALINQLAAKKWFPGRNPVGEYILAEGKMPRRVVGITANAHTASLADEIRPTAYLPLAQVSDDTMKMINGWFPTTFVIRMQERTNTPDPEIARAAEAAITAVDPEIPAAKFAPMQDFLDKSVAAPRFFSWMAGAFAVFALGLAQIGLFGLLSYQVSSRTREIGVRMALGAKRRQILSLVLRNGLILTSLGLALGVAASFVLRGLISSLLYTVVDGLGRADSVTILGNRAFAITLSAAAMLVATIAASLIPARRAAYLEPTEALRAE